MSSDLKLKIQINGDATGGKKAVDDTENSVKSLGNRANETKNYLTGLFGISIGGFFTTKLVEAVQVIQDLRLKLSGLTTSQQDYANSEAYLTDLSGRHHKSVGDLTDNYAKLLVMEQSGVITRQQSTQMLEGFSNVMSKTGASSVQTGQALYGLSQALSQGTVQSAEFNQIIEPLPGLGNHIAEAFGVKTVGALRKLIGAGQVTSEAFGVAMVKALQKYDGAAERSAGTLTATYADVSSAYTQMAKEVEKPVAGLATGTVNLGKEAFGWIKENKNLIAGAIELIAATYAGKGVAAVAAYTKSIYANLVAQKEAIAATIKEAEDKVAATTAAQAAAVAKNREAQANVALIDSNLGLVKSSLQVESASLAATNAKIASARAAVSALTTTLDLAEAQLVLAKNELAAAEAAYSQALANTSLLSSQAATIASALNQSKAQETVAASALVTASANVNLIQSNLALVNADRAAESATLASANAQIARSKAAIAAMSATTQTTSIQYLLRQETEKLTAAESARALSLSKLATLGSKASAINETLALSSAQQSAAQTALNQAKANTAVLESNLALVKSDIRAATATIELTNARIGSAKAAIATLESDTQTIESKRLLTIETAKLAAAETERSASQARLIALSKQANAIAVQQAAATQTQIAAQNEVVAANIAQTASQNALNETTARSGLLMTKLGGAMKSALAFVGGPIGAAAIALYGLYLGLEKVTDSEGRAAAKAKVFADAVSQANEDIKKMSLGEVGFDTQKTEKNISAVKAKVAELEKFSFKNLFNLGDVSSQRANLLQQLDILAERKKQLVTGTNEKLINFDGSKLSAEGLTDELIKTQQQIDDLTAKIEPLKAKQGEGKLSIYDQTALQQDELRLNAFTAKMSNLNNDPRVKDGSIAPLTKKQEKAAAQQAKLDEKIQAESFKNQLSTFKDAEDEKVRLIKNSGQTQSQIDAQVFQTKLKSAREATDFIKAQYVIERNEMVAHEGLKVDFTKKELEFKKATLTQIHDAYKTQVTALNALEQEHRDKAIALDKEIKDVKKQGAAGEREIARAGMTEGEVAADKTLEIEQKTAQYREMMRNKDYTQAAEIGKELNALTKEQGMDAVKNAAAGDKKSAAQTAQNNYKQSIDLTTQALEAQKAEEQAKAAEVKAQADLQRKAFENVGNQIQALNDTLTKGAALKIVVDSSEVDKAKQKIDALNTEKSVDAPTQESPVPAQKKIYKTVVDGKTSYSDTSTSDAKITPPPVQNTPLPAHISEMIKQLKPLNLPNVSQIQNAQTNQNKQEKVLGVYKLELASPAGTVNATIKPEDKDIFEAYQRYAKSRGRMTRDGY